MTGSMKSSSPCDGFLACRVESQLAEIGYRNANLKTEPFDINRPGVDAGKCPVSRILGVSASRSSSFVGIGVGALGLDGVDLKQWNDTFAVNLTGPMLCCRKALRHLDDGASMVFISSIAGLRSGSRSTAVLPAYRPEPGEEDLLRRRGDRGNKSTADRHPNDACIAIFVSISTS